MKRIKRFFLESVLVFIGITLLVMMSAVAANVLSTVPVKVKAGFSLADKIDSVNYQLKRMTDAEERPGK